MKVVVLGGGVIGLSSAYYLQEAGHQVTVIDQNDILNIGGFSDQIFNVISKFIEKPNHNLWIEDIEKIQL